MLIKQPSKFTAVIRQKRQLFSDLQNLKSLQSTSPSTTHESSSNYQDHHSKTQDKYSFLEQTVAQIDTNQQQSENPQISKQDKKLKHYSFSIEQQIIHSLYCIQYQQSNYNQLLTNFQTIIGTHIKIKGHFPFAESLIGANLLTNGIFHELWFNILKKQNLNFSILKPKYYQDFKHAIKKNTQNFNKIFTFQQHQQYENINTKQNSKEKVKFMKEKDKYDINQQKKDKQQKIKQETTMQLIKLNTNFYESNKQSTQIVIGPYPNFLNQLELNDQKSENFENIFQKTMNKQPYEKQQQEYLLNTTLLKFKQNNQRRLNAQIVCNFFSIPSHRTFSIKQIKIQQILEVKKQHKFQYAVLLAKNINKIIKCEKKTIKNDVQVTKNQAKSHIFISCYNYINLEQLIRIQITFEKIYGFIAYENSTDFYGYLDKFQKEKSEKDKSVEKRRTSLSKERKT